MNDCSFIITSIALFGCQVLFGYSDQDHFIPILSKNYTLEIEKFLQISVNPQADPATKMFASTSIYL